jgi:superfamily II DNA or RNA helicase
LSNPADAFDAALAALVSAPIGGGLRPYQADAIHQCRDAVARGVRRVMAQLATGGGKTLIASAIASGFRALGLRVLFVVPAIELVDQTLEKFYREGLRDIGVIQAGHWRTDWSQPVQIASVQTLMRRQIPPADLVFIDEGHKWFDFYRKWMLDPVWADVPFIGLSATPWTKGLGAYYNELIVVATMQDLIDAGYLSPFVVSAPAHPDLKAVRTVAGDYHERDLSEAMNRQPLVADIVQTWLKHGVGRPTLCFAVNRAHAEHLQQRFEAAGVRAGYIDCETPAHERAAVRRKFANGEFQVVCNVGVLTMGVDWDVRCIVLARPTKSEILFVQIIGRGLRPAQGKDHCLILDHSDTHLRVGFVTDLHQDHLDDGRTRESRKHNGIRLPKECPRCSCLRPASTPVCPHCGFVAKPGNRIKPIEGELYELRKDKARVFDPERVFGELKFIARARGYKPGWAWHQYKEYTGEFPRGLDNVVPRPPSPEMNRWLLSRRIAWAKSRSRLAEE